MFSRKKPEVLVVGAGPVGLFTALALHARGVAVQVVEAGPRSTMRSYALALHPEALRLFESLGLFVPTLERSHRVRRVGLFEGTTRRGELRINEIGEDHSYVSVLPQDALEEVMADELRRRGVRVLWNHRVRSLQHVGDAVDVSLDKLSQDSVGYSVQHTEMVVTKTMTQRFAYVVGADGHDSTVRQALGIGTAPTGPAQEFAVFEFLTDRDPGDEMRLGFGPDGATVYWPLPGQACRFSFESEHQNPNWDTREKDRSLVPYDADEYEHLDETHLRGLLEKRAPWFDGAIAGMRWKKRVRFEPQLAQGVGHDRAWLVGDSVHVTGPAGVQSMNVAFREALHLVAAITRGLAGFGGAAAFASYERGVFLEWRRLLGRDEWLTSTPATPAWLTAVRNKLLPCIPASGPGLERLARQIGLSVMPGLPAVHTATAVPAGGEMLAQG